VGMRKRGCADKQAQRACTSNSLLDENEEEEEKKTAAKTSISYMSNVAYMDDTLSCSVFLYRTSILEIVADSSGFG